MIPDKRGIAAIVVTLIASATACGSDLPKKGPPDPTPQGDTGSPVDDAGGFDGGGADSGTPIEPDGGGGCLGTCSSNEQCVDGSCQCVPGAFDCDGDRANGCESTMPCSCTAGEERGCYTGPNDTRDIGACGSGVQRCSEDGATWGRCEGEVLPTAEVCGDGVDNDCDGELDEGVDADGDGYSTCQGDCCDSAADGCAEPARVHPGAYEWENGIDDDCSGVADDLDIDCATTVKWFGATAAELARAMGICKSSAGDGDWGLVDATLTLADGTGQPASEQVGVLERLGGVVPATEGPTMAVLSNGTAAAPTDPGGSENLEVGTTSTVPATYTSAHGGVIPPIEHCNVNGTVARDSASLRLRVRAPEDARGLQIDFRYFSREFPLWVCSQFNDFFLILVESGAGGLPADRNIATDPHGNPISVNSDVITTCRPLGCSTDGTCGGERDCVGGFCSGVRGTCPDGAGDLAAYETSSSEAGATSWLRSTAPVAGGEVVTVAFHIWDSGDAIMDSTVLLDGFRWLSETPAVETVPR